MAQVPGPEHRVPLARKPVNWRLPPWALKRLGEPWDAPADGFACLAVAPVRGGIATAGGSDLHRRGEQTGRAFRGVNRGLTELSAVAVGEGGEPLAAAGRRSTGPTVLILRDRDRRFVSLPSPVLSLALSANGTMLAAGRGRSCSGTW